MPVSFQVGAWLGATDRPTHANRFMKRSVRSILRRTGHQVTRALVSKLPRAWRFALFRSMVQCDPAPDSRLQLKIAATRDELEACFGLLHDAYVAAGFMRPDPSGLRATIYHALPTTTTLCAKVDGQVAGTVSLVREGVFGFPMQSAFDLSSVRRRDGRIAEVSALAVHPDFRKTGGWILLPLMKFMYEYAARYFDTRHLLIAVNPDKIELYESLLFFTRLQESTRVDRYDFANGAPAVGACLDLQQAVDVFRRAYTGKASRRDLARYFLDTHLANIQMPHRPYHTTNDPVLTPELLDYFFNQRTQAFATLDDRRRLLLRSIYDQASYGPVLPPVQASGDMALRRHPRFTVSCPATLLPLLGTTDAPVSLKLLELSRLGFSALCTTDLSLGMRGRVAIELGPQRHALIEAEVIRRIEPVHHRQFGFVVNCPDESWLACVHALETGQTHADLMRSSARHGQRLPRLTNSSREPAGLRSDWAG